MALQDVWTRCWSCSCKKEDADSCNGSEEEEVADACKEKNRLKPEERLVIFGTSASGKSTLLRQMRLHFGDGLPPNERRRYTPHIRRNILSCFHKLAKAMSQLGLDYETAEGRCAGQMFEDLDSLKPWITEDEGDEDSQLPENVVEAGRVMWGDPGVKQASLRGNEFHLMDNAVYLLDSLDRIAQENYVPTLDDVLRMRYPTTGAMCKTFELPNMILNVIDLGGQRQERSKWLRYINKPSLILFVASLAEFDNTVEEDQEGKNRLLETIEVFRNICNSRLFTNVPLMVFFNKVDVFQSKLEKQSLSQYFPEYKGESEDEARDFILNLYKKVIPDFSFRFTCAVDVANTKAVLSKMTANISRSRIFATGIT